MGNLGPIVRAMLRNKLRFGLIAFEVALTLAIVVNCATMIQAARAKLAESTGFCDDDLVSISVTPFDAAYKDEAFYASILERDLDAIARLPGVVAATQTYFVPWEARGVQEFRALGSRGPFSTALIINADDATLKTLGIALVEGRTFTRDETRREHDRLEALFSKPRERNADGTAKEPFLQEIVVTQGLARRHLGEGPALGGMFEDRDGDHYRVVGVVDRFNNPSNNWMAGDEAMFFATRGGSFEGGTRYLVRTEPGKRDALMPELEATVLKVEGGRDVHAISIASVRARYHANDELIVRVLTLVLFLVVFVTVLGVVGLTSFSVTERTRQIGIRRALGAQRVDVVAQFVIENALVSALGVAIGVGFSFALNGALVAWFGGARLDAGVIFAGGVVLFFASVLTTLVPAARAAWVAPTTATKNV